MSSTVNAKWMSFIHGHGIVIFSVRWVRRVEAWPRVWQSEPRNAQRRMPVLGTRSSSSAHTLPFTPILDPGFAVASYNQHIQYESRVCAEEMAMAAVFHTSLPVYCAVSASQISSHHGVESTAGSLLGAVSSRHRTSSRSMSRAVSLSCASSLGGSSLAPAWKQTRRRNSSSYGGAVSTRCESSSDESPPEKIPFGYTRKDVILIGVGLTAFGVGLKYGLEFIGMDPLRAGNVVQIVMVAGLTIGWISSYVFRVSNKDMTYAKQLKDYENKVMEKRLEELPEAELETMLAQVEEEKIRLQQSREKRGLF